MDDLPISLEEARKLKRKRSPEQVAEDVRPTISEDSIALEYVERHADLVRFDTTTRTWHVWNGGRWRRDDTRIAFDWTRSLVRVLARDEAPSDRRRFGQHRFARGVEEFAQTDQRIAVTSDMWDPDPHLLGTPSYIVDLRSGQVYDPNPDAFITRSAATDPDDDTATCIRWFRFLDEATGGDNELKTFLQRFAGYCLTGETSEQVLVFIYGPGGTGKTVFVNTILRLMGDYACAASMETFTASQFDQHPEELARLHGARMVTASETEAGRKWRENRIKQLTGGDAITARFMRQNSFTFRPRFKLLMLGNHAPTVTNLDDAIRRRFLIASFPHKPTKPDPHLEEALVEEWPGILCWAIRGAVEWYKHGLPRPAAVNAATQQYFDEQDIFAQWLDETCDVDIGNHAMSARSAELYASWSNFAKAHGEPPGSQATFNGQMRQRGHAGPEQIKALSSKGFRGVRLKVAASYHEPQKDRE
jgi:putative DNA primase/helicase